MSKILKKRFFGEKVPFLTNSQNFDNKLKNQKNMKKSTFEKNRFDMLNWFNRPCFMRVDA